MTATRDSDPMLTLMHRSRQPEIMDDPDLDPQRLALALNGLARINWWSGSIRVVWPPIRALAAESHRKPLRVLDIASGAGDVPVRLALKARRAALPIQVEACDINPRSLEFAQRIAERNKADVRFFQLDALNDSIPDGFDIIMSSLFFHHLDDEQAIELLGRMARAARRMVLINDLVRNRASHALVWLATRLFSRSDVVHYDGPRSVEAAFTVDEMRALAHRAGLEHVLVQRRHPCRMLLTWRRL